MKGGDITSTRNYDTLEEQVAGETRGDIIHRTIQSYIKLTSTTDKDYSILVPHEALVTKYRYFLNKYTLEITLNELQYNHFRQNPHAMSDAFYGTTQYWSLLLFINNCTSRYEFDKMTVKYYNPNKIDELINEIMIHEEEINSM